MSGTSSTVRAFESRGARARSDRSPRASASRSRAWISHARSANTRRRSRRGPSPSQKARRAAPPRARASRGLRKRRRPARADRVRLARPARRRRTPAARRSRATTSTSEGPARPSMPHSPKTWRFASVTQTLPGPTILSTRAIARGAERQRRDRLRAAGGVEFVDAAQAAREEDRRLDRAVASAAAS